MVLPGTYRSDHNHGASLNDGELEGGRHASAISRDQAATAIKAYQICG